MKKIIKLTIVIAPVIFMVWLIPLVLNDYLLAGIYAFIICASLLIRRSKNDLLFLIFGFIIMTASEYFFIKTGVEIFNRHTLLGIMPIWLPFLWAYGFVAIKHAAEILGKSNAARVQKKSGKRRATRSSGE